MALWADGGSIGSKPYAASGKYINRMSNFCASCTYSPSLRTGKKACPFNYLYWNFLLQNKARLKKNPRLSFAYKTLENFSKEEIEKITRSARDFFRTVCQ